MIRSEGERKEGRRGKKSCGRGEEEGRKGEERGREVREERKGGRQRGKEKMNGSGEREI